MITELDALRAENATLRENAANDTEVVRAVAAAISSADMGICVWQPGQFGERGKWVEVDDKKVVAALCPPPKPVRRTGWFRVGGRNGRGYQDDEAWAWVGRSERGFLWTASSKDAGCGDAETYYGAKNVKWEDDDE